MNKRNIYHFFKKYSIIIDQCVYILVLINVIALCINTFDEAKPYEGWFLTFEYFITLIFILEYIFRCVQAYMRGNIKKYIFSLLGIVDLASIVPYFLPITVFKHANFIKIIRLFRLLTMFKLYRYSDHVKTIVDVLYYKKGDLIATFIAIFFVIIFCSYAMFVIEHEIQPDKLHNIIDALWWGIGTIATIGYGNITPVTIAGKLIASFLTLLGVGLVAIPSAILSAGFVELQNDKKSKKK